MPKYLVQGIFACSSVVEKIDAETPELAVDAWEEPGGLCHQCADDYGIGDPLYVEVLAEDGSELLYSNEDKRDAEDARKWRELVKIAKGRTRPTLADAVKLATQRASK